MSQQQTSRPQSGRQTDPESEYRKLPSVDTLLREPAVASLVDSTSAAWVGEIVRTLLDETRNAIAAGASAPEPARWPELIAARLASRARSTLRPVINATGVVVHTNLGRAPLSQAARQAIDQIGVGYSNLEYDLDAGQRGSRYDHTRTLLGELTGAEDALVVNNNASAVFLVLAVLCSGREVLISRGQLVEIGGGFRIPDVLRQSGARLVEVGTTNRTHRYDFERAVGSDTAALMRVHSSNFRQIGFVTMPELPELVAVARTPRDLDDSRPLVIDDLGSGTLLDTRQYGLAWEPTVQVSVEAGADLITFSGDKLLGGPQAGLIVGRSDLVAQLRRHPLARALRVDKMTLAALDATLRSYQRGTAPQEIPVWQMISASLEQLQERAEGWRATLAQSQIPAAVRPGESTVGGGSLPGETLPTALLTISGARLAEQPDSVAERLRQAETPVLCRIQQDQLLFDPRTVLPEEETRLLETIVTACRER